MRRPEVGRYTEQPVSVDAAQLQGDPALPIAHPYLPTGAQLLEKYYIYQLGPYADVIFRLQQMPFDRRAEFRFRRLADDIFFSSEGHNSARHDLPVSPTWDVQRLGVFKDLVVEVLAKCIEQGHDPIVSVRREGEKTVLVARNDKAVDHPMRDAILPNEGLLVIRYYDLLHTKEDGALETQTIADIAREFGLKREVARERSIRALAKLRWGLLGGRGSGLELPRLLTWSTE